MTYVTAAEPSRWHEQHETMHAGLLPFQLQADVGGAYATVSSHCILPLYLSTLYSLVEDLMLRAAASGGPRYDC